ncbi:MAG: autotransporter domain-containing protein [Parvibaculum sp.]|nr:autotransporter domain-containing protein [Parvibaculum sp.]
MFKVVGRTLSRARLCFFCAAKTGLVGATVLAGVVLAQPAFADTYATTGDYPGNVVLSAPTTLKANTGVTATVTGQVTGGQALSIDGPGVVVFDNNLNDWTGTTTILRDGTLRGSTDTIAGSSFIVNEFGTLDLVQSGSGNFAHDISGDGTAWVSGLDEDEAITFTGTITIATGLMAGSDGHIKISDTGSITVGGTASTVLLKEAGSSLDNAGTLTHNGVSSAVNADVEGTIGNSGTITAVSDAIYLSHGGTINNRADGQILSSTASGIVVRGDLQLDNSGTVSSFDVAIRLHDTGTITNRDGGTINTDGTSSAIYATGSSGTTSVMNEAGGTITSGLALIELYNTADIDNAGTMTGGDGIWLNKGGSVTNQATGTITATNGDAYGIWILDATADGMVIDNTGTIYGEDFAIVSYGGGNTTITNSGTLEAGGDWAIYMWEETDDSLTLNSESTTIGYVAMGDGDDTVLVKAGAVHDSLYGGDGDDTLTLDGDSDGADGSIGIADILGFENLTKAGTGDWTLTGSGTLEYATINAGTGTAAGTLIFDGTADVDNEINVNGATIRAKTVGAFGTGTIHAIDPTIEFGATGTYTNDISLEVAAPASDDPTTLSADSGVTATLSGAITRGDGDTDQPLTIGGAGTIILTNSLNNWTGVTTINDGATLQGTLATISGSSFVANGTLAFNQTDSGTLSKDVSGTGQVTVSGLSADNVLTFAGELTNEGGITGADEANIEIASTGSVSVTGVAVTFSGDFDNTLTNYGAISTTDTTAVELGDGDDTFNNFAGSVTGIVDAEDGDDILNIDRGAATGYTLTGTNWLHFETTNLNSGTVTLTGNYESTTAFTIGSDAAFVGSGAVKTASFQNQGTLVVGSVSGTGTLAIDGDFENDAGATYVVKFSDTANDLLDISGAATLAGAVEVTALNSITKKTYTVLTANGGISGTFDTLVPYLSPFVRATLDYTANDVLLLINPIADSAGGSSVAEALFHATGAGPELTQALNDISNMSEEDAGKALDQMTPEQSDAPTNGTTQTVLTFHNQTSDRIASLQSTVAASRGGARLALGGQTAGDLTASLVSSAAPDTVRFGLWGRAFGLKGSLDAQSGLANGLSYKGGGIDGGFDTLVGEETIVGLSAGYARILNDPDRISASSDVTSYSLGLYAATQMGAADLAAQLGYTHNDYHASRRIVILPATNVAAASDFDGYTLSARFEAGYTLTYGDVALRPVVGLDGLRLQSDAYTEIGAPGFNLTQDARTEYLLRSTVGVAATLNGGPVTPSLGLRWGHDIVQPDGALSYAFAGLANSTFGVNSNTPDRDAALIDAGLDASLNKAVDLSVVASADLRENAENYGLAVKLRLHW